MNQSLDFGFKQDKRIFSPLSVFYLVTILGLLLGAWQQSLAEPVGGSVSGSPVQADSRPANVHGTLAERDESVKNSESSDRNSKTNALTIPGIQSAILTVSKEIKTTAPIANLTGRPAAAKQAKAVIKPASETVVSKSSARETATVSKGKEGYYLELPSPRTSSERGVEPSAILSVNEYAGVQPATTVPVSPVPSQWLDAKPQQSQSETELSLPSLDPESLPLDLSATSGLSDAATNALVRVTLGLLAVLGLLLGFSRVVLPRLMARYPAFFENLKRQGTTPQTESPVSEPTDSEASMTPVLIETALDAESLGTPELHSDSQKAATPEPKVSKVLPKPDFSTQYRSLLQSLRRKKKQALPPVTEDASPFNLLFTSPLGKDKELHLVEIRGRQMVIASTPYSVTLIRDLSETPQSQSASDWVNSQRQGSVDNLGSGLVSPFQDEIQTSETVSETIEEEWSPQILLGLELEEATVPEASFLMAEAQDENLEPDLHADVSAAEGDSEGPDFISPKSNAYATRPQRLIPLTEGDLLYQRYLEIVTSRKTELDPENGVLPAPSLQTVVILNEYDDAYGY